MCALKAAATVLSRCPEVSGAKVLPELQRYISILAVIQGLAVTYYRKAEANQETRKKRPVSKYNLNSRTTNARGMVYVHSQP